MRYGKHTAQIEEWNKGLTEDIRELAQDLLDDPVTGPIFRDAGTHRNFTRDEWSKAQSILEKSRLVQRYPERSNSTQRNAEVYNYLTAAAVARRVGEGDFFDVHDPKATAMIKENEDVLLSDPNSKRYRPIRSVKRNYWRPMKYDDFVWLFRKFMQTPNLKEMIDEFMPVYHENNENWEDSEVKIAFAPIEGAANLIAYRYGFIQNNHLAEAGRQALLNNIDVNDDAEVRRFVDESWLSKVLDMGDA